MNIQKPKIVISHYSAYCLLRYARSTESEIIRHIQNDDLIQTRIPNKNEVYTIRCFISELTKRDDKLDIILNGSRHYKSVANANCHLCNANLSNKLFCIIKVSDPILQNAIFNNIVISCPELTICNLSNKVPPWKIMQWIMECMGNYSLDINHEKGFIESKPIIDSTEKIQKCIKLLSKTHMCDSRKMSMLIKYVAPMSASPAETNLYILLCGPRKLGFYQIKKMQLNQEIEITNEAATMCGQKTITPDISLPSKKIAIEYDSKAYHENAIQGQKDKRRFLALEHDKWKIFTFVPYHMHNLKAFEQIVKDILKACGQDVRIRSLAFQRLNRQNFYMLLNN